MLHIGIHTIMAYNINKILKTEIKKSKSKSKPKNMLYVRTYGMDGLCGLPVSPYDTVPYQQRNLINFHPFFSMVPVSYRYGTFVQNSIDTFLEKYFVLIDLLCFLCFFLFRKMHDILFKKKSKNM